jgi:hypothetical protein
MPTPQRLQLIYFTRKHAATTRAQNQHSSHECNLSYTNDSLNMGIC